MKSASKVLLSLFLGVLLAAGTVSAEEKKTAGQVFDLGDVLVMDKGDEVNPITTNNVVSVDDMEKQGATSVADTLEFTPGIDIQFGGKGQAGLKLRGFDQKEVRVLIDGVPAHETYFGSLDLDQIPVDSIAKIKVIKGASSVLYGPNTMGGVVNIITKKGTKDPYTSLMASYGNNDTQNFVFNHGMAVDKFNYWITASHRITDGFELADRFDPNNPDTGLGSDYNEDGGTRDLSDFEKNTVNLKLGYEFDKNSKIYLAFDYHDNEKGCPTFNNNYWAFNEWLQWHLSLSAEHDFSDVFSMRAKVYYVDHDDTLEDVSWDANHTTARKWFEQSMYDDFTLGGEIQGYLDFGDTSLIRMGFSYMKDNHIQQDFYDATTRSVMMFGDPEGWQAAQEYEVDIYSFGIEDDIRLFDRMTLSFGVSYDVHDPIYAHEGNYRDKEETWNPQVGVSFDVTPKFNLYASIAKKTRFPQMKELYTNHSGTSNINLKPQTTIAYELGTDFEINKFFSVSAACFFNDIDDKIDQLDRNDPYTNYGESEIKGFELSLDVTTPWDLDILVGYTYLESRDRETAASAWMDSANIPENKLTLDLRHSFDFGLSSSFQMIYTGDQIYYDGTTPIPVDPFVICNARISQEISFTEKIKSDLFFEVKNIFDENYHEGSGPTAGRNFLAGLRVSF